MRSGASPVNIDIRDIRIPFFMSAFDILVERAPDKIYPGIRFDDAATIDADSHDPSGLYLLGRSEQVSILSEYTVAITSPLDAAKFQDFLLRFTLKKPQMIR